MRSIGLQVFIWNKWVLDGECIESESKSDFGVWRFYIHLEAQLRTLFPLSPMDSKCIESESKSDFGVWRFQIHVEAQLQSD